MGHDISRGWFIYATNVFDHSILRAIHFVGWCAKEWPTVMMKFGLHIAMNYFYLVEKVKTKFLSYKLLKRKHNYILQINYFRNFTWRNRLTMGHIISLYQRILHWTSEVQMWSVQFLLYWGALIQYLKSLFYHLMLSVWIVLNCI